MNWCAIETTLPTTPFFASFNLWDTNRQLPKIRYTRPWEKQMLSLGFGSSSNNKGTRKRGTTTSTDSCIRITMKDRSKNRKPLQRGRNLSIEAIQTIQALKRAAAAQDRPCSESLSLEGVFSSKFRRLLKLDMMAVLHELLRQNECLLVLKVLSFPPFPYTPSLYSLCTAIWAKLLVVTIEFQFYENHYSHSHTPGMHWNTPSSFFFKYKFSKYFAVTIAFSGQFFRTSHLSAQKS